jgi:RES domain-containing protein
VEPAFDLLAALERVDPREWSGMAYRHTAPGRAPLSGQGARMFGGRWNPRDLFPTIYLAYPRDACIAEFRRMAEGQGGGPASFLPRDVHEVSVTALRALDLTSPDMLRVAGLSPGNLSEADWSACQAVGEAAHFLGFQGVIAPSATGLGQVIAVFEDRVTADQLQLLGTTSLETVEP